MALKHSVYDTDTHFLINPITRALVNESSGKNTMIQYDHNSERITFEIPRQVEGHDMSKCDAIQVHYNNIDSSTKKQNCGVYKVDDMQISPDDENVVILSWLISGNATKYVGSLNFLIRFACTKEDGTLYYVWNTAVYSSISISSGIYNGDVVAEEYADILAQWEHELINAGNEGVNGIEVARTEALQNIETARQAAVSEIENADRSLVASAITNTSSGTAIALTDISPLEHILRVKARSKNSIPYPYVDTTKTSEGITYTDNGDGTVTANGTSTGIADFILAYDFPVKKGMIISGAPEGSNDVTFEIQVYKDVKNVVQSYGARSIATTDFVGTARIRIRSGYTANNLVFKPQLEVGSATEYTPFVDVSTTNLIKSGKNFAQINSVSAPLTNNITIFEGEISGDFVLSCDKSNLKDIDNGTASLFRWTFKDGTQAYSARVDYLTDMKISGVLTKVELLNYCGAKSGSIDRIQLEPGTIKTEFEPSNESTTHPVNADGTVEGVTSLHPTTTLISDTEGVVIDVEYNVDTKKYINNQIDKRFAELAALIVNS